MIVDVLWLLAGDTIRAAIYYLLFGKGYEILFQVVLELVLTVLEHYFLIDLEFHYCSDCEYVRGIEVAHVLHRGHILTPVIVIVILKLCNLEIFFGFSKGGDSMIKLLKLSLSDISEASYFIIELLIQLLALEEDPILREIKHEPIIMILICGKAIDIFTQIILIDTCSSLWQGIVG